MAGRSLDGESLMHVLLSPCVVQPPIECAVVFEELCTGSLHR
jgi:hypothetical protein